MTLLEKARAGKFARYVKAVARAEKVDAGELLRRVAAGWVVVPANRAHTISRPCGIGLGLRTKVNANIGTSADYASLKNELQKLGTALEAGADTVMDLSTSGNLRRIRRALVAACPAPIGSVPLYDAACGAARQSRQGLLGMSADSMLQAVRQHAEDGIDFITIHSGVTKEVLGTLRRADRVCGIVSRGGTFLAEWIKHTGQENPLYERFDEVLEVCREFEVTLSLGDGLRPGALADAFDAAQVHELQVLAGLARRARKAGVQVMIEGPGHVPLDQVPAQVQLQKQLCDGAPFYVLGPLVTDVAPGYDHITSAIGGAVAAAAGADFLCYVTPSEHLALPGAEQVREGVMAARIAAHAGDIAKGVPGAGEWDRTISRSRRQRDWEGQLSQCLDPVRARAYRKAGKPRDAEVCSMCGEYCVFKIANHRHPDPKKKRKPPSRGPKQSQRRKN